MGKLRDEIDAALSYKVPRMTDREWGLVKAAIDAAQPPGVDEICAALGELDGKKATSPHTISLAANGSGVVRSDFLSHLGGFDKGGAVDAIRSLIPEPEPKPTACRCCKHFISMGSGREWYDYYCRARKLPQTFNPVTGARTEPDRPWKHCRDVNDGACDFYAHR